MLIDINFLPLDTRDFIIPVFRSKFNGETRQNGFFVAHLPISQDKETGQEYSCYRVGLSAYKDAEAYSFHSNDNPQLMTSILWFHLKQWAERLIRDLKIKAEIVDRYEKYVCFIVEEFKEGQRVIKAFPYYLGATKQYGILLEFAFKKNPDTPFGREVQQLSFSLDRSGKSNANSYIDKYNYIRNFVNNHFSKFGSISICNHQYDFLNEFVRLEGQELKSRTYVFGNGHEDKDKIKGVKLKPYSAVPQEPLFVFVFKESERNSGNELYRALTGKGYPSTFDGMQTWFNCTIDIKNVTKIIVDLDTDTNATLLLKSELENIIQSNQGRQVIGIFIDSYSHYYTRSDNYAKVKQVFFSAGVPLQVVLNDRIIQSDGLKWAISGIGLQLFSKLGGIPWKVKPSTNNCLIFGIGQAHDLPRQNGHTTVKKYFAYSVCLDSTGIYRSLGILCDAQDRDQYYADLENNIISQIEARLIEGKTVTDCVIHTPFRMRNDEMNIIKRSVDRLSHDHGDISFTVMRINTHNRFFGFADNNIKIPYESSYVRLSSKEYLVWFEGLIRGKEYINKRVANPTYIDFWYGWKNKTKVIQLLQDTVNLAGASWRGFKSKLEPISIFYPRLIAGFICEFRKLDNNQDINRGLEQFNTPWFL